MRNAAPAEKTTSGDSSLIDVLTELLLSLKPMRRETVNYLMKAEVEVLKTLKALLENQIEAVEKRLADTKKERVKKIKIEG
jgi:hypothetical protein